MSKVVVILVALAWSGMAAGTDAEQASLAQSQAGFYRTKIGSIPVTSLSDGTVRIPALHLLHSPQPQKEENLLAASFLSASYPESVNAYLIQLRGRLILVDAGTAELYGPTLGKLPQSLRNAGFAPEQITDIFLTHIHTDHSGGLVADGERVFPNATVHLEQRELAYWIDPSHAATVPDSQKRLFREAAAKITPYVESGQIKTFEGTTEFFPEFRAAPAPGHTPGHTFYILENEGEKLVFWGDVLHVAEVQFPDPSITIEFDTDERAAGSQRKKAFAEAAKEHYLVAPAHIAFPGIGHVRAEEEGYRWLPIPYLNDAH